ncbi:HalOD1 output domain-containing protein [Halomicroarcula sp. GCM10025324]|uniref:HalOD1 output domain-containing protein n=1 Tax=Haloarcula TaxID=2237 RepID=UPI00360A0EFF
MIRVVEAVSSRLDTPPNELPPLNETIDAVGLDRLCTSGPNSLEVSFPYAGLEVTVTGGEEVTLSALSD